MRLATKDGTAPVLTDVYWVSFDNLVSVPEAFSEPDRGNCPGRSALAALLHDYAGLQRPPQNRQRVSSRELPPITSRPKHRTIGVMYLTLQGAVLTERFRQRLDYVRERFIELDRLLRGETTHPRALGGRTLEVSARGMAMIAILLAVFYGACMGSFSLLKETPPELNDPAGPYLQVIASMLKTPALFLLTLLVTLPSLYVSNALIGSRLTLLGMTRLLTASIAVNLAVLASLGTIVLFFSLTTTSYPFVVLLNVAAFGIAGVLGLSFLLQTLHRVLAADDPIEESIDTDSLVRSADAEDATVEPAYDELDLEQRPKTTDPGGKPSAIDMPTGQMLGRHTRLVFRCWIVLFSLVGAQMGWVLRPFIGQPNLPFTLFRDRESNFFASVFGSLGQLLFGG